MKQYRWTPAGQMGRQWPYKPRLTWFDSKAGDHKKGKDMLTLKEFISAVDIVMKDTPPEMDNDLFDYLFGAVEDFLEEKLDIDATLDRKLEILTMMLIMIKVGKLLEIDEIGRTVGMEC